MNNINSNLTPTPTPSEGLESGLREYVYNITAVVMSKKASKSGIPVFYGNITYPDEYLEIIGSSDKEALAEARRILPEAYGDNNYWRLQVVTRRDARLTDAWGR